MNLICGNVNKIRWSCKSDVFGIATIIQNSGTSSQCAKICFVSLVVNVSLLQFMDNGWLQYKINP